MSNISTKLIEEAIYNLCFKANTCLNNDVYSKIHNAYLNAKNEEEKNFLKAILQNAKIAYDKKLPLCQDTGQVIVFIKIGQNVNLEGEYIETVINRAVENCYKENFFRKSVVKNSIFDRQNTTTNTPAIIYNRIVEGDKIEIKVLIKGAGSENKSHQSMQLPTTNKEELIKTIGDLILSTKMNSCPPMFIGIGIGATAEKSLLLSKKALTDDNLTKEELLISEEIKKYVNDKNTTPLKNSYVLDVKTLTTSTHIACMPVGITINCHSDRYSKCTIENNTIKYNHTKPDFVEIENDNTSIKRLNTNDIEQIKALKIGENILLSGEIYVARDMAHKRLSQMKEMPINLKDKIIFYAGPCPNKPNEIIGSIGPTTAGRMDKFAIDFYNKGLLATIGKGERNTKVQEAIQKNNAKYFTVIGGIAALLAEKITAKEIIAFEDLGAEALYRLTIKDLPIKVELG